MDIGNKCVFFKGSSSHSDNTFHEFFVHTTCGISHSTICYLCKTLRHAMLRCLSNTSPDPVPGPSSTCCLRRMPGTYVCTGISFENQGGRIPGGLTGGSIQLSQLITYIRVTNEQKT